MRKLLLTSVLLFTTFLFSHAQSRLGFKMGYHSTSAEYTKVSNIETSPKMSFDISIFGDIRLNKFLYIQPGVTLIDKSFYLDNNSTGFNYTITPVIIEIPAQLVAKLETGRIKPFVGAGGFIDLGLSGNISTDDYIVLNGIAVNDGHKISWGNDASKDDFRKDAYGISFIGGAELNQHISLNLTYTKTLSNMLPKGNTATAKNQTISLAVGIIL